MVGGRQGKALVGGGMANENKSSFFLSFFLRLLHNKYTFYFAVMSNKRQSSPSLSAVRYYVPVILDRPFPVTPAPEVVHDGFVPRFRTDRTALLI